MLSEESASQTYHHGNVKEALVDVAIKLIEEDQVALISLRRLAREVGITPSAVYNHFTDKDALMLAIKIRIYGMFNQFFEERCSKIEDPEKALLEVCLSYFSFSQEYPSKFQFLFSSTLPLEWSTPEAVETFCHCVVKARKLVYAIYQKHQILCDEETVVNNTLLLWSQLHGIVLLRNSGSIPAAVAYQNWPEACALNKHEEVERLIERLVTTSVKGLLHDTDGEDTH